MKKEIIIEEVISQRFEIECENEDDIIDIVRDKYRNGELVLDNPTVTSVEMLEDELSGWITL